MLNCTQLSFIQLGGGIAVGVHVKPPPNFKVTSIAVRTATAQVCSPLSNDITSQIWLVGSALCDIMIPICMTYYVGFSKLHPLDFGERSTHNSCSLWQLSRYDTPIKQTKRILNKIMRLTIETGALTGT
jgi:hypothetical protein